MWAVAAVDPRSAPSSEAEGLFIQIDTDGSGALSREEIRLYLLQEGASTAHTEAFLSELDADFERGCGIDLRGFEIAFERFKSIVMGEQARAAL